MAKLYSAANTHLGRKYPFFSFFEENVLSLRKTYFRENIDHQLYSSYLYFPFVYLIRLLHL